MYPSFCAHTTRAIGRGGTRASSHRWIESRADADEFARVPPETSPWLGGDSATGKPAVVARRSPGFRRRAGEKAWGTGCHVDQRSSGAGRARATTGSGGPAWALCSRVSHSEIALPRTGMPSDSLFLASPGVQTSRTQTTDDPSARSAPPRSQLATSSALPCSCCFVAHPCRAAAGPPARPSGGHRVLTGVRTRATGVQQISSSGMSSLGSSHLRVAGKTTSLNIGSVLTRTNVPGSKSGLLALTVCHHRSGRSGDELRDEASVL